MLVEALEQGEKGLVEKGKGKRKKSRGTFCCACAFRCLKGGGEDMVTMKATRDDNSNNDDGADTYKTKPQYDYQVKNTNRLSLDEMTYGAMWLM